MDLRPIASNGQNQGTGTGKLTLPISADLPNACVYIMLKLEYTFTAAPTITADLSADVNQILIQSDYSTTTDGFTLIEYAQLLKARLPQITYQYTDPSASAASTYTAYYAVPFNGTGHVTAKLITIGSGTTFGAGISAQVIFDMVAFVTKEQIEQLNYDGLQVSNQTSFQQGFENVRLLAFYNATGVAAIFKSGSYGGGGLASTQAEVLESGVDNLTGEQYLLLIENAVNGPISVTLTSGANISYVKAW